MGKKKDIQIECLQVTDQKSSFWNIQDLYNVKLNPTGQTLNSSKSTFTPLSLHTEAKSACCTDNPDIKTELRVTEPYAGETA